MLSVYMRPWTLHPPEHHVHVPLLTKMREVVVTYPAEHENTQAHCVSDFSGKRRRIRSNGSMEVSKSYARTWQHYIDGNVVSNCSKRYILNLLSATAARVVEREGSSDNDSEDSDLEHFKFHAGNMDLVHDTLRGIAANDEDEGRIGFGRHATCIRMGRELWETPALRLEESRRIQERTFDDGTFPDTADSLKAARAVLKQDEERPQPFSGKTLPFAHLSTKDYGARIDEWLRKVKLEAEPPTQQQLAVLEAVAQRVLQEFADEHSDDAST